MRISIGVQVEGGILPEYASEGAAGADLRASEALDDTERGQGGFGSTGR